MKTTVGGDCTPQLISTAYHVDELKAIESIRESCFPAEALLQNNPLASSIVDGVVQLMKAFPDVDYNSEAGRWQLLTLVRWLLRPEETNSRIKQHQELSPN